MFRTIYSSSRCHWCDVISTTKSTGGRIQNHPPIYLSYPPPNYEVLELSTLLRNARERYATMCIFFELVYATNSQAAAAAAASVATLGFMSALVNVCVYCMSSFQLPEQIKKLTTFYGFGWFVGSVPSCVLCLVSWTMTELRSLSLALIFLTKQWIHKLNYLDATKCRM